MPEPALLSEGREASVDAAPLGELVASTSACSVAADWMWPKASLQKPYAQRYVHVQTCLLKERNTACCQQRNASGGFSGGYSPGSL